MNLFFILLFCALVIGGYYVYQRLLKIERDIRADQYATVKDAAPPLKTDDEPAVVDTPSGPETAAGTSERLGLREQIISTIEEQPGLAQTDLYSKIPDAERRVLQQLLRELDQSGRLKREKKGNSYLLYPLPL